MSEQMPSFVEQLSFLLRMIFALLVVAFFIFYFFSRPEVNLHSMGRTSAAVLDGIMLSPLTKEVAIFDQDKLNKYHNTFIEPYVRSCRFGYTMIVESGDDRWEFGYSPLKPARPRTEPSDLYVPPMIYFETKTLNVEMPAGIMNNGAVRPAKVTFLAYDTYMTRMTCLIETAYDTKKVQRMKFKKGTKLVAIRNNDGDPERGICLYEKHEDSPYFGCRNVSIRINNFGSGDNVISLTSKYIIQAIPLKNIATTQKINCKDAPSSLISENDEIKMVYLCMEAIA